MGDRWNLATADNFITQATIATQYRTTGTDCVDAWFAGSADVFQDDETYFIQNGPIYLPTHTGP